MRRCGTESGRRQRPPPRLGGHTGQQQRHRCSRGTSRRVVTQCGRQCDDVQPRLPGSALGDERTKTRDNSGQNRGMPLAHPGNRPRNPGDLRGRQRIGDGGHTRVVHHLAVSADRAREAFACELARSRAAIGRRRRVVDRLEIASPDMYVAAQGKTLGREPDLSVLERHGRSERLDRRSHGAGIDQFARRQTSGIGPTERNHFPADDGNEVGARGANVDEQSIGQVLRDRARCCGPIRCSHQQRRPDRVGNRQEPAVNCVDGYGRTRKCGSDRVEYELNAVAFGAKHLRQFRGHRDRVRVGSACARLGGELAQHLHKGAGIVLKLEGPRAHGDDRAASHACNLRVHSADIPAEGGTHRQVKGQRSKGKGEVEGLGTGTRYRCRTQVQVKVALRDLPVEKRCGDQRTIAAYAFAAARCRRCSAHHRRRTAGTSTGCCSDSSEQFQIDASTRILLAPGRAPSLAVTPASIARAASASGLCCADIHATCVIGCPSRRSRLNDHACPGVLTNRLQAPQTTATSRARRSCASRRLDRAGMRPPLTQCRHRATTVAPTRRRSRGEPACCGVAVLDRVEIGDIQSREAESIEITLGEGCDVAAWNLFACDNLNRHVATAQASPRPHGEAIAKINDTDYFEHPDVPPLAQA